jgi:hypothetical protein
MDMPILPLAIPIIRAISLAAKARQRGRACKNLHCALQIEGFRRNLPKRKRVDPALSAWAVIGLGTVANVGRELGLLTERKRRKLISEVDKLLLSGGEA